MVTITKIELHSVALTEYRIEPRMTYEAHKSEGENTMTVTDVLKTLDPDFFLIDYPFQREVIDISWNERGSELEIYIKTRFKCSNGFDILFLSADTETLDVGVLYESHYHHPDIKDDAWTCAKKLENYLKNA